MSKVIRRADSGRTVYIGERHFDVQEEKQAEHQLGELLPMVSVVTDLDGAKLIPVTEITKIQETLRDAEQKSRQAGYEDGYKAGREEGIREARQIVSQFDQAITDAVKQRQGLLNEAREKILQLVLQVARKVTYDAAQVDSDTTLAIIDGVIDSLVDRSRIKVKVHPDHLPVVEQNVDRFLSGSTAIKELGVEADPRVKHGGCFIETPTGDIDARIDSQIDVIENALRNESEDA